MKFVIKTLLFFAAISICYNIFVTKVTKVPVVETMALGSLWAERSQMKVQSYLQRDDIDVVIVGSSMSGKFEQKDLPKSWHSLAFASDCNLTGLKIVLDIAKSTGKKPKIVLIEANVTLDVPRQSMVEVANPVSSFITGNVPIAAKYYKPSIVGACFLNTTFNRNKSAASIDYGNDEIISYDFNSPILLLDSEYPGQREPGNNAGLKVLVDEIEKLGIKTLFFEVPQNAKWQYDPVRLRIIKAIKEVFPEPRYQWLASVDWTNYSTTDNMHLDRQSCKRFIHYLESSLHKNQL